MGWPVGDARRVVVVEAEACADVGAADVDTAGGERNEDTTGMCVNPGCARREVRGVDVRDLLVAKLEDRRRFDVEVKDAACTSR